MMMPIHFESQFFNEYEYSPPEILGYIPFRDRVLPKVIGNSAFSGVLRAQRSGYDYWQNSLTKTLIDLHDGVNRRDASGQNLPDTGQPPKVLFVTATSGIPFGFALKEFWKKMYQDYEPLKFMVINPPGRLTDTAKAKAKHIAKEAERLSIVGKKTDSLGNAAVFDEFKHTGATFLSAQLILMTAGYDNRGVNYLHGEWSSTQAAKIERPIIRHAEDYFSLVINSTVDSRRLIRDMKKVGLMMADQALGKMKAD